MTEIRVSLFIMAVVAAATVFASNCTRQDRVANSPTNISQPRQETAVRVDSVEVFGWGESNPKQYIKLDQWKETTDSAGLDAETFDLICQVQNVSDSAIQHGEYIVLATMEFVVAPTYLRNGDVNKIMKEGSWGRVGSFDDFKTAVIPFMIEGEKKQITIKDFNLGAVLKHYSGSDDTLWPWAMRANIHILNRDTVRVAQGQVTMPIIPSRKRLALKQ